MFKIHDRNYQMKLLCVNEHMEVPDYSTVNLEEKKFDTAGLLYILDGDRKDVSHALVYHS